MMTLEASLQHKQRELNRTVDEVVKGILVPSKAEIEHAIDLMNKAMRVLEGTWVSAWEAR